MKQRVVNLDESFAEFRETWTPHVVGRVGPFDLRLARMEGAFVAHHHDEGDEMFLVLEGAVTLALPDGEHVVRAGELFVVPRGVEHNPVAEPGTRALLLSPTGTRNTGHVESERTIDALPEL